MACSRYRSQILGFALQFSYIQCSYLTREAIKPTFEALSPRDLSNFIVYKRFEVQTFGVQKFEPWFKVEVSQQN